MIDIKKLKEYIQTREEYYYRCMYKDDDMRSYYHGASNAVHDVLQEIWRLEAEEVSKVKAEEE